MQTLLTGFLALVLLTALGASVLGFAGRRRRRRMLSRQANVMGLRFWVTDPFNIPGRYAQMAVIAGGHSPVVHNVTYGQMAGLAVRALDFNCEVGHGPSRLTQRWGLVLVELPRPLAHALLFKGSLPGLRSAAAGRLGDWSFAGDGAVAAALAKALGPLEALGDCCVELRDATLLAAVPASFCKKGYNQAIELVIAAAGAI